MIVYSTSTSQRLTTSYTTIYRIIWKHSHFDTRFSWIHIPFFGLVNFEHFQLHVQILTFHLKYSRMKTIGSTEVSRLKPRGLASSSTVFYVPENNCGRNETILMLSLLAREYALNLSSTLQNQLYVGYRLNTQLFSLKKQNTSLLRCCRYLLVDCCSFLVHAQ